MKGAYNCVLNARQVVPQETYVYFMELLAKTIIDEITGFSEKAYDYLSLQDAKKIFTLCSKIFVFLAFKFHEDLQTSPISHEPWICNNLQNNLSL